jgi:hypothetical protein
MSFIVKRIRSLIPTWKDTLIMFGVIIIWIFVIVAVFININQGNILQAFMMFFSGLIFSLVLWFLINVINRIFPEVIR